MSYRATFFQGKLLIKRLQTTLLQNYQQGLIQIKFICQALFVTNNFDIKVMYFLDIEYELLVMFWLSIVVVTIVVGSQ